MFSRLQWFLLQLSRQLWVRAAAFSLLGIATALVALLIKRYIPADLSTKIGSDSVDHLLNIIATSMLAVMIFSLSTMVSAFSAATSNTSPRATRLLSADSTAQNALATFLGSFLFSLVGIIVLQTGLYGDSGRVVLFVVTVGVIVLIVVTLLRWSDYVLQLGRVGPTSAHVEEATSTAMVRRRKAPNLGGKPLPPAGSEVPAHARVIHGKTLGYIEHIDMESLQASAEGRDLQIHVVALPGHFVGPAHALAFAIGATDDNCIADIRAAFSIAIERSFDQDPRFGVCVLAEIASRALSPGINDPGTAIDILGRGARILALWSDHYSDAPDPAAEIRFDRVFVPTLQLDDLFDDFFIPIARDGAGMVEVGIHLQKMLQMLATLGDARYRSVAILHAAQALTRAEKILTDADDLARVRAAAANVGKSTNSSTKP